MHPDRTARLAAFSTVRGIVADMRGVKLHDAEADTILWAAEGLLLAGSPDDSDVTEGLTAFETLMDDLEAARWAENTKTAAELRDAFAACAPQPVGAEA